MGEMAAKDSERFPAGRAAVVLLNYCNQGGVENKEVEKIETALKFFTQKARDSGWTTDLLRNIPHPQLKTLLLENNF
jgi:hypothetical protein